MAEADVQLAEAGESSSSVWKWIIVAVAGIAIVAGAVGGAFFAMGMLGADDVEAAAAAEEAEVEKTAIYVPIEPPFTVNFQGSSRARFLQVSIDLLTRDPLMEDALKKHMPVIRNNLVMLLSSKTSSELGTLEGKQKLQDEALASIQGVLERETGDKGVEAVFFTSFVMQ